MHRDYKHISKANRLFPSKCSSFSSGAQTDSDLMSDICRNFNLISCFQEAIIHNLVLVKNPFCEKAVSDIEGDIINLVSQ